MSEATKFRKSPVPPAQMPRQKTIAFESRLTRELTDVERIKVVKQLAHLLMLAAGIASKESDVAADRTSRSSRVSSSCAICASSCSEDRPNCFRRSFASCSLSCSICKVLESNRERCSMTICLRSRCHRANPHALHEC